MCVMDSYPWANPRHFKDEDEDDNNNDDDYNDQEINSVLVVLSAQLERLSGLLYAGFLASEYRAVIWSPFCDYPTH